ncbi:hypothetical protein AUJ95_06470 [Candidatus Desantisbacteria bacterium CG2_30_40_21]|uniref:Rrf2 family transcriptional regulator n=5 Tax=unclassified Candidatus Desantisiibacteriota TaxID=3106372 RepID=A0A2M7J8Q1_9BACT|nr:MAG: hypothetical protein AUJ95_06470 [Candidatus Desantisbacteria bacterium CG2_30_40_21]PIP39607.1 MAG: hypothetical protein COX18_09535 [Candidatus Desantisbacteria bacterium CG23_combo_of_CG06-09_8_20_14_all_40_23]PIX15776.1 MAG: hypothetical protein COZ71_09580 [Candidatus Desantisbacteria bacterium CG_4_8_14_3_um_filter_40_12]PIY18799.1 MAG: hypothetical protein COZ13_08690 [Candidatus Desantisbacteria bacterium CG_4_10_14_3_um_filter_40_18]PJB28992.1 MAG: hypothetical protein CO110_08
MKLPIKVHYAIVIMTDIAVQGQGNTVTGNDIAHRQNISFPFVSQILNKLKHAGLLESVRGGVLGGYILKGLPSMVTIKQIAEAVEAPIEIRPSEEIKTNQMIDEIICSLWERITEKLENISENVTLEDIIRWISEGIVTMKEGVAS